MPTSANATKAAPRRDGLRTIAWFLLLGAVLLLQVWFPPIDAGPLNDTYSVDVGGRNAFYQFVERRKYRVGRNLRPLERLVYDLPAEAVICILGPARPPTDRERLALLRWVEQGGRLLLAAPWQKPELSIPEVSAAVVGQSAPNTGWPLFGPAVSPRPAPARQFPGPARPQATAQPANSRPGNAERPPDALFDVAVGSGWSSMARVDALNADVLIRTDQGAQAVKIDHGNGWLILVATDYLFSNKALFQRDTSNGVLAVRLLQAADPRTTVIFDESLNISGTPRVVGILLDPLIRPATVQMAVLLVLFAWSGSRRFGAPLPPARPARHDVTAHTNALGNLYYRSSGGVAALNAYLEQMKSALKLSYVKRRSSRVIEDLARRSGLGAAEITELLDQATEAADRSLLHRRDAAYLIRRLARFWQAVRQPRKN
jgi:hypothetical protein